MSAVSFDFPGHKLHDEIRGEWNKLKPAIETGKVASRKEAYLAFSSALKITKAVSGDSELTELWQKFLEQSTFSIEGTDSSYNFSSILDLLKEGKTDFTVRWKPIVPNEDKLKKAAEHVNGIALDALGDPPGAPFFHKLFQGPITFGLIAKYNKIPIASIYTTFVDSLHLVHCNFLGRKVNYPGVRITESLQSQFGILQDRFPETKVMTLLVDEENIHAKSIYETLGFVQLEKIQYGADGEPKYFYGKKLVDEAVFPTYAEFKQAYDEARKPYR